MFDSRKSSHLSIYILPMNGYAWTGLRWLFADLWQHCHCNALWNSRRAQARQLQNLRAGSMFHWTAPDPDLASLALEAAACTYFLSSFSSLLLCLLEWLHPAWPRDPLPPRRAHFVVAPLLVGRPRWTWWPWPSSISMVLGWQKVTLVIWLLKHLPVLKWRMYDFNSAMIVCSIISIDVYKIICFSF